jgi:hypothetical protein
MFRENGEYAVMATLERVGNEVKLRISADGREYALIFPETVFEKLQHRKGEKIKKILIVR